MSEPAADGVWQEGLSGDRPIVSPEQDALGRTGFAAQIRHELEATSREEGLVLAVTGEWGSGKSSVVNLALGPLEERDGYRVVRFNPWLFSGTPQLIEHFFSELRAQLKSPRDARLKEIGEALVQYGKMIDPLRFLPGVGKTADSSRFLGGLLKGRELSVERQRERLAVLPTDLANATDRWPVAERGVWPSSVVVAQK